MAIYSKLVNLQGRQLGVYTLEEFQRNIELLTQDDQCAVELTKNGKNYILPIRNAKSISLNKPGIYSADGEIAIITYPDESEEKEYMPTGNDVLIFDDYKSLQAISDAKKKLDDNFNKLLESPIDGGNIYKPPLLETDSAEMRAMKECIIAKNIDLDKYKDRFGANYPNDKRKLKDDNITLNMISRMCENLDLRLNLQFTDANGGVVPNPMNKIITANIVPGDGSCIITETGDWSDNNDFEEENEDE